MTRQGSTEQPGHDAERAELLAALFASSPDAMVALDPSGQVMLANVAAHGLWPELRTAGSWLLAQPVEMHETARTAFATALSGASADFETTRALADGEYAFLAHRLAPLRRGDQTAGVVALCRDVTEAKRGELRRLVRDRVTAVGNLAQTVSHEINNPLAALLMGLDLVMRDLDVRRSSKNAASFREELDDMREAANRTRQVVGDLRIFSRPDEDRPARVDLRNALSSAVRMVRTEIRQRARLVENYAEVPAVEAVETKLGQLFLNLVVNASQAIEERGADDNEVRIETSVDPKGRVIVTIADTGRGIEPELQPRVFQPFFTTRPRTASGIGLSICSQIVAGLGGSITFESEPGKGSVFRIALPAAARQASPVPATPTTRKASRRGKVLVIDDESMVVGVVARFLGDDHDVVPALEARQALELLTNDPSFDAILCDLMMPQMTGMELYETLNGTHPALAKRMVFMTAGAFTPRAREFLESVPNARLEKPFDPRSLRALVDQLVRVERPLTAL